MHDFKEINLTVVRGDNFDHDFDAKDNQGNDIDLTSGYKAWIDIRKDGNAASVLKLSSSAGDITLGNGEFNVKIDSADMDMEPQTYRWQVEFEYPSGQHFTHAGGFFTVKDDITKQTTSSP